MKKHISKFVTAFVLAIALIVSSPVKDAYAFDIIGTAGLAMSALQMLQAGISNATDRESAKLLLRHQFSSSSVPSSSTRVYITYDQLSSICIDFVNSGLPCDIFLVDGVYYIRATGEPYALNDLTGASIDSGYTYKNKYFVIQGNNVNSKIVCLCSTTQSTTSLLSDIKGILNSWAATGGVLTQIKDTVGFIYNAVNDLEGYVDGVEGLLDSVVGYLLAQSSKLSNIETYTSNISTVATNTLLTANRLLYTDANGNAYSAGAMLYRIWQNLPTSPQDYSTALDLIRQYTLLTSNRLLYESGNTRMSAAAMLYDIRTNMSNVANRTLNTANRLQTTVDGTTYTAAELLYNQSSTLASINGAVGNLDGKMSTMLLHVSNIYGAVDSLESAFSTSNSHLNNIAVRAYNNGVKLDNILSRLNDMYGYMYIEEEQTTERGLVRAGELVPVGIDQLVARGTALSGEVLTNVISIVSPVGLIQQGVQTIADIIEDFEIADQTAVLRNIYSTLHTSVNGVDFTVAQLARFTAQSTNDIYEWLTSADLLDDNTVVDFIDITGDYVNDAILNGNNIVSLFYHAYLNVVPSWQSSLGSDPFGEAIQYFDDLNGGAA